MNSPRLSVIIPCYNQGKYIMDTLSCFDDYHQQDTYELIIVDDGSKDEKTLSVLKQIASEGYQVIYQSNQGVSSARNNGIQHARGEYILPLDGDDMLSKEYIYEGITILDEHPEYAVVYCDGQYFGDKTGPWKVGSFNLQRLMLWDYIHVSGIYRKSAWAKVGGYDTHLNFQEKFNPQSFTSFHEQDKMVIQMRFANICCMFLVDIVLHFFIDLPGVGSYH